MLRNENIARAIGAQGRTIDGRRAHDVACRVQVPRRIEGESIRGTFRACRNKYATPNVPPFGSSLARKISGNPDIARFPPPKSSVPLNRQETATFPMESEAIRNPY